MAGPVYTSAACRAGLAKAQVLASYSRPGNPHDNAQAEADWSTLKTELLPRGDAFASLEEAPDWKSPTTSTPTSTSTAGTPRSAIARPIDLNATS